MKLQSASARQKYKYEEKSKKSFLSMHTAEAPAMLSHGLNQQTTNKHLSLHDPEAKSQETDFTGFHYFPHPCSTNPSRHHRTYSQPSLQIWL